MDMIVAAIVMVSLACVALMQTVRNFLYGKLAESRTRMLPFLLGGCALTILCDMLAGGDVCFRMCWELMLGVTAMTLLTSSLRHSGKVRHFIYVGGGIWILTALYYLCCALDWTGMLPEPFFSVAVSAAGICTALLFVSGIWGRIREVKAVMKSGDIWSFVCLSVDAVYVVSVLVTVVLHANADGSGTLDVLAALLFCAVIVALGLRVMYDSAFVILQKHERRIIESMKVTNVGAAADISRIEAGYREVYERVVEYFEKEKPYLNGELTINDIVKVVYTNRLYISKAISQFTGRNFCQFVNFYRVKHSVDLYREHPELKVHELGTLSGFNSLVTFHTAFRLYMGESPGDWCRKENGKICRSKK